MEESFRYPGSKNGGGKEGMNWGRRDMWKLGKSSVRSWGLKIGGMVGDIVVGFLMGWEVWSVVGSSLFL